jgi:hypothetical protein
MKRSPPTQMVREDGMLRRMLTSAPTTHKPAKPATAKKQKKG